MLPARSIHDENQHSLEARSLKDVEAMGDLLNAGIEAVVQQIKIKAWM
jgi:hypothetical protein